MSDASTLAAPEPASAAPPRRRFRRGARIGPDHTILAVVDRAPGRHPVLIVWDHARWCPQACKVFSSRDAAAREAATLAALDHPAIVRSFGLADGTSLVIEFVDGRTLADVLDFGATGRMRLADALRVAIHLGGALAHMHARGFVHLDLAPSNVILRRDGRPVLIDLGAARRLDGERPRRPVGTDPYMAPEECELRPVSPAADVFGLGVLLFELLTGELPFPRGTRDVPFPQTMAPPASARRFRSAMPGALDDLLHACLAREPEIRPGLVQLLPALHGFIRSGPRMWPSGFEPAPPAPVSRATSRRRRSVVA
jgi:serine/threonine protein kinase